MSHTPERIVISGASGLVGRRLCAHLEARGVRVQRLVRREARDASEIAWRPLDKVIDAAALEGAAALVHLAGEPVAGRWTPSKKRSILSSRTCSTTLLAETLAGLDAPPALLSASAIGYYGDRPGGEKVDERDSPGDDFLAEVCQAWEAACDPARAAGVRVVNMRIGVVLSSRGGALAKLLRPFKLGLGGRIGGGRQGFSWITLDDTVRAIDHLLTTPHLGGPFNLTAPHPVTQATFSRALGRALQRPTIAPLPGFVVRAIFGEFGEIALLQGAHVVPQRLLESDFVFQHPELQEALQATLVDE